MKFINMNLVIFVCLLILTGGECGRRKLRKQTHSRPFAGRAANDEIEELRRFNVFKDQITLSGFSSGGSMAQILQVAYSSYFQGVGVFSHTFIKCGPGNGNGRDFDRVCTKLANTPESEFYNPELVPVDLENYASQGLIDDLSNLKNKRLYVYTGLKSSLFTPVQALNILVVYERYIQNPYKIKTRVQNAGFVMPTDNDFGGNCTSPSRDTFFIGNCGFSGAYEMLRFIYADDFKVNYPRKNIKLEKLRMFNQVPFQEGLAKVQVDDIGFYYVPSTCNQRGPPCRLHVFMHGCFTNRNLTGDGFIRNSGFMEVAEENRIIMLFPQNLPNPAEGGSAIGCWDTFGVSGPLFATKQADQVIFLKRMVDAVVPIHPTLNNDNFSTNFNRPVQ